MKILNLQIIDDGVTIRDITFNESGASIIYGDIEEKDREQTSNSIGKSTLINMIDFIFASDSKFKEGLEGVVLIASVKFKNLTYTIERTIRGNKSISVRRGDDVIAPIKKINDLKDFFCIDRSVINLQFIRKRKLNVISQINQSPKPLELVSFLILLNLGDLAEITQKICDIQDEIKKVKENTRKIFIEETQEKMFKLDKIDKHIYGFKDELRIKEEEEANLSHKIQELKISDEYSDISFQHTSRLADAQKMSSELSLLNRELERIDKVLQKSKESVLTADKIVTMFEKSKQELPGQITKTLFEVEDFYRSAIQDRENILVAQKERISSEISEKTAALNTLKHEADELGVILSRSNAYQKALELYKKVSIELQQLRFREGKLSALERGSEELKDYDEILTKNFADLAQSIRKYEGKIEGYRDFVNEFIKKLYGTHKMGYLVIRNRDKHKTTRPMSIDLEIDHDSTGGIGQVKNNVVDYLIFNCNTYLEFLVQDSSCFAEVDPKQICTMLEEAHKIAEEKDKQYIVAINKYELGDDAESIKFVEERQVITLSEASGQKLMRRDFD